MGYALGIDLGTSFTAAAVARWGAAGRSGVENAEPVALGSSGAAVPTVVHVADDGEVLVGEAALRRCASAPERVVREFKRRVGDDVPFVVGTWSVSAHDLVAQVVRWVVDVVAAREGAAPDAVVVTHPAAWGEHRKGLVSGALEAVGLGEARFVPEPEAAALHYASRARVPAGSAVAVYDLGGGTFDAAVVRTAASGPPVILGTPTGLDDLGGADFDDAVLGHVLSAVADRMPVLDPRDPAVASALERLRRECVEAKETLSADTEATIPVLLPGLSTRVRLVRAELEGMLADPLTRTVEVFMRALDASGLARTDLRCVLLVGGSSRLPLVAEVVSRAVGRPVAIDADPKLTIALGAAAAAADVARAASAKQRPPEAAAVAAPPAAVASAGEGAGAATTVRPVPTQQAHPAGHRHTTGHRGARSAPRPSRPLRTRWAVASAAAAVLLVAAATHAASEASDQAGASRITSAASDGAASGSAAAGSAAPSGSSAPGASAHDPGDGDDQVPVAATLKQTTARIDPVVVALTRTSSAPAGIAAPGSSRPVVAATRTPGGGSTPAAPSSAAASPSAAASSAAPSAEVSKPDPVKSAPSKSDPVKSDPVKSAPAPSTPVAPSPSTPSASTPTAPSPAPTSSAPSAAPGASAPEPPPATATSAAPDPTTADPVSAPTEPTTKAAQAQDVT